jgi:hypothetical protein
MVCLAGSGGMTSGSGAAVVVTLERGASGEHVGAKNVEFGALLSELRYIIIKYNFFYRLWQWRLQHYHFWLNTATITL